MNSIAFVSPCKQDGEPIMDRFCVKCVFLRPHQSSREVRLSCGFTLIELVAVMSIISVLIGMLLPAVQHVRESARRAQCSDQIRQLALSTQNFHSNHRFFPTNGGAAIGNRIVAINGQQVKPFTRDFIAGSVTLWGVASNRRSPRDQTGPWCFSILPQIEMSNAYESDEYIDEIGIFRCPSRDRGGAALPASFDRYGDYQSGGHAMAKTDYVANGRLILGRPDVQAYRDIWDGTSHTVMLGEKAFDPVVHIPTTWYWDESIYIGGSAGTARTGLLIVPDAVGIDFRDNWGSAHGSLAHFVFADGHVDTLSTSTDAVLFDSLLTPRSRDN